MKIGNHSGFFFITGYDLDHALVEVKTYVITQYPYIAHIPKEREKQKKKKTEILSKI